MPLPPSLPANTPLHSPGRDPAEMLAATLSQWRGRGDLWIFGYASLIWRPEFSFAEERIATAHGYHRALKMWSRINRGTPECPGLV
ncbi:MAG: gamma-glutamylcyclotransferase, partial [Haliea sp.]